MVRIPVEYQEVEYLESSGTQYIITDKYLSEDVITEFKYTHLAYGQRYAAMFGAIVNSSSNPAFVMFRDSNGVGKVTGRFGKWTDSSNNYIDTSITYSYGDILEGKCGINWIEYDGTRYTGGLVWDNALSNADMGLFCRAINGSVFTNSLAVGRIYYLKFCNASELVANLIPCYRKSDSEPGMYDTVTKQFFTNAGSGTFIVGNDVSWDTASLIERRRQILLNTPHLTTESANPLTFQTDISANIKDCKIYFEPIQEGEGDPSPDNVRVISGWDGIDIYHYGANLFPLHQPATAFRGQFSTGDTTISSASVVKCWTIYVGKNKKLMYQRKTKGTSCQLAFCDTPLTSRTGAVIYNALNMANRANQYINSGEHPYLVMCATDASYTPGSGYDTNELMLSFGTTAKPYVPRTDPSSITIPFPKTIYGGYVDLTNGEVVETWKNYDYPVNPNVFTDLENGYYEVGFGEVNGKGYGSSANSVCSVLTYGYSKTPTIKTGYTLDYVLNSKSNRFHSVIYSETPITQNTARQWFIDNNVQLVREMYTSTTHQLADGLTHITLGQDISPRPNGRSSTGGYANSTATGSDGCKFVYFELGWPTEEFLQYSADISRRSEFVSDSKVLINGTTTDAKLGEMVISTGSATDYDGDALVYMYISVPSDCTDLESKRAYLAEHPIIITHPKKTLIPYTIDLTDLKPVKGTNNIWSNANNNIEIKFWKH